MANEGLKVHPPPLADLETVNLPVHGSRGEDTQLTVAGTSGNRYKAEMLWKLLKILLACKKEQSVSFEIVDDLKEAVKKKLSLKLDDMTVDVIIRRHDEADDLRPGFVVDESLINDDETPLQVTIKAPGSLFNKISEKHFQPIEPVQCQPFSWKMENDEAHQMLKVEEWFKERIKSTMQLSCKRYPHTKLSMTFTNCQYQKKENLNLAKLLANESNRKRIDRFDCHGKLIIGVGIAAKEAKVKLNHDIQHEKPVDITIPEEIKREIMDMFVLTDCNDTGEVFPLYLLLIVIIHLELQIYNYYSREIGVRASLLSTNFLLDWLKTSRCVFVIVGGSIFGGFGNASECLEALDGIQYSLWSNVKDLMNLSGSSSGDSVSVATLFESRNVIIDREECRCDGHILLVLPSISFFVDNFAAANASQTSTGGLTKADNGLGRRIEISKFGSFSG
ncbi:hypothetical protein C2G38_2152978 [Gigaspora rosea]|uniref:Uncharacterized protein n=1 Tax=Gigaspora rosea TaxID=44941 RepID=A0A397WBW9_9GLOM|nr:hypothetical protein C2G38_2152978 [Gigaspora rosea]